MNIATPLLSPISETTPRNDPSPQLVKAANAFEANFLGELLKPMREDPLFGNGSGLGGDSLGSEGPSSGSMGTIGSLASEALAQAIAKQGGLGIAKMVLAQLAPVEKTAAQTLESLAGTKCGGCAPELTMTPASSLEAGSVAILGKGILTPATPENGPGNSVKKLAIRASDGVTQDGSLSVQRLVPIESGKK